MTDMVAKEGFTLKDLQKMEKDYQNLRAMLYIQSKVLTQMVENNKGVFANKMRFVLVHTNASLTHLNDLSEFINNAYKAFLTFEEDAGTVQGNPSISVQSVKGIVVPTGTMFTSNPRRWQYSSCLETRWNSFSKHAQIVRERIMSDIREPIFHCPFCGKVRRKNFWIQVTVDELVKLYRSPGIMMISLVCPKCKDLKHGGTGGS